MTRRLLLVLGLHGLAGATMGCADGTCPAPPRTTSIPAASAQSSPRPLVLEDSPDAASLGEDGWAISGGARDAYVVRHDTSTGRAAWLLEPYRDTYGKYGTWMRHVAADSLRGKRVRVSMAVRTEGASRRADFWARAQAADSPGDGLGVGGEMQTLAANSEWATRVIVIDVPITAASFEYGVGVAGPGRLWVDGAHVEVVGADVALTRPARIRPQHPVVRSPVPSWDLSGDDVAEYSAALDGNVKHAGHASGTLRATVAAPKGPATLEQWLAPERFRGKRVRMRAYVRTENVAGWVGLWLRVDAADPDHHWTAFDNMSDRPLRGTHDWARYDLVLDVGRDASAIAFGMLLDGAGQAWIDDVTFDVVDPKEPTTGHQRPPRAEGQNLDFEQ